MKNKESIIEEDTEWEEKIIDLTKKDIGQFHPLYEKYFKKIFLYIYHKTNERDISADLTSQVFVKALTNIHQYQRKGASFSSWLFRIAHNEVMQLFRSNSRQRWVTIDDHMLEGLLEDSQGPDYEMLEKNMHLIINELEIQEVQLLELKYFDNKSYKEMGVILNMTETNVKTKTWRVIEKIRKKIKEINE